MKPFSHSRRKASAIAPANIAFIKYWGKTDEDLRLPLNSSLSMNLSGAYTTTTVEFSKAFPADSIEIINDSFSPKEKKRITTHLDRIRAKARIVDHAHVMTQNNFPKGSGIASSASGFAALTLAATVASGLKLSEKELSVVARLGSGSASRSIPGGFVVWEKGNSSANSYAYSIHPASYWDLRDILVIVNSDMKQVDSHGGMRNIRTSPLWENRAKSIPDTLESMLYALKEKNFQQLGALLEADSLNMHAVMQSQQPPINYWSRETHAVMKAVKRWRTEGLPIYATIDAGPNVHVICEGKNKEKVLEHVKKLSDIQQIIVNKPAKGARLITKHLF